MLIHFNQIPSQIEFYFISNKASQIDNPLFSIYNNLTWRWEIAGRKSNSRKSMPISFAKANNKSSNTKSIQVGNLPETFNRINVSILILKFYRVFQSNNSIQIHSSLMKRMSKTILSWMKLSSIRFQILESKFKFRKPIRTAALA